MAIYTVVYISYFIQIKTLYRTHWLALCISDCLVKTTQAPKDQPRVAKQCRKCSQQLLLCRSPAGGRHGLLNQNGWDIWEHTVEKNYTNSKGRHGLLNQNGWYMEPNLHIRLWPPCILNWKCWLQILNEFPTLDHQRPSDNRGWSLWVITGHLSAPAQVVVRPPGQHITSQTRV